MSVDVLTAEIEIREYFRHRKDALPVDLPDTSRHPHQHAFVNSTAKRNVIRAGRRGGKTYGTAIRAVKRFQQGARVLYAAPTQDQLDRFWVTVCRCLQRSIDSKKIYKNETRHILEIPGTEQRIRAKTAWNADSLRGDYADELILDEWQLMNEDAWRLVGAPMLADKNGNATFIYTPPSLHSRSASKADDPQHAAKLFKRAQLDKTGRWAVFHFGSKENPYISQEAIEELTQDMTALAYRMEIEAEDVDENPGALWTRAMIDDHRITADEVPDLERIVVAIDPSATADGDEAGVMTVGKGFNHGYLLEDNSIQGSPATWAKAAVDAYHRHGANRIVAEANNGGEMVKLTIQTVDPDVPVTLVHASRGKQTRAEPVAALYEHGRGHHVGFYSQLEDEMCLAADTLITTAHGLVPIQDMRQEDLVLTRKGLQRVLWAGQTGRIDELLKISTSGGRHLLATSRHPVYNHSSGEFVAADELKIGEKVEVEPWPTSPYSFINTASQLSSMKYVGSLTRMATTWTGLADCSTASFGPTRTAQSLKESIFTIRTRIDLTLLYPTWHVLALKSMFPIILATSGTRQSEIIYRNTFNVDGQTQKHTQLSASDAIPNLRARECEPCSASLNVAVDTIQNIEVIKTSTPVYNLTVEGYPEYYANGILVHNCLWMPGDPSPNRMDALVWAFTELGLFRWKHRAKTEKERIEELLRKTNPELAVKAIEQGVANGTRNRQGAMMARIAEIERIRQAERQSNFVHPLADPDVNSW